MACFNSSIRTRFAVYDPLRSYLLSLDKCPTILKKFFQNDMSEPMLYFIHSHESSFHNITLQIEGDEILAAEVCIILNDFILQDLIMDFYH